MKYDGQQNISAEPKTARDSKNLPFEESFIL